MKDKILHWWFGCAKFNFKYPHWKKSVGLYPTCTICCNRGWWMWGYKHFKPDYTAQKIQGVAPDASATYWAEHDGYAQED